MSHLAHARLDGGVPSRNGSEPGPARWKRWLPGVALACVGLVGCVVTGVIVGSFGYGLMLGVPIAFGCAIGYGVRVGWILAAFLAITILAAVAGGLISMHVAGLMCGLIASAVFLGPVVLGAMAGAVLRRVLRRTRFARRHHLPVVLLFALTGGAVWLEERLTPEAPVEIVRTERVLAFDAASAWSSLVFYEEIRHDPPWLARFGLPHPQFTNGTISGVGDVKVCVYDKGHLVKRIADYRPIELLAFDVVEQNGIEDRSVRLVRGSFRLEPLGPDRTRIALTTEYVPLLQARRVWRPFERRLAHMLHEHVLYGIELEARRRSEHLMVSNDP